jgi:hypothetical protein
MVENAVIARAPIKPQFDLSAILGASFFGISRKPNQEPLHVRA